MADLTLVTYCGLYCGLCGQRVRVPSRAAALKQSLEDAAIEYWGPQLPGFHEFWGLLERFSDPESACPGCRQGGGFPGCEIRKCARDKGVEVCPQCDQYPCELIATPAAAYPTLLADGKRMQEKGVDAWLQEQEARARTGFAYVDIRHRD